jgi:UDP-N-acetylenolpyruvoylglucosamine reductase
VPSDIDLRESSVAELRHRLSGPVFLPGEPGYSEECSTFNLTTPLRPRVAVGAETVADVQAAVRFAAEHDLGIAIRGGGHIVAKQRQDVVLVNMSRMRAVSVDADARRVRFGGGALWQDVLDAAMPLGLAPMNGSSPTVGATGYLLAGGQSPCLGRSFGWAAEHIDALEVVTADGAPRRVTAEAEPELFFALRGTKGNFGIVTAVELELFPVTHIYGGGLWFAGEDVAEVLHTWREWAADIPNEMSSSVAIQRLPPDPALPAPLRGAFVVHVRIAYNGTAEAAEKLLVRLRNAAPTILDTIDDLTYAQAATIHLDPPMPLPYADRSCGLAELTAQSVDALVRVAGPQSDCKLVSIELRRLGGALDREPATPDAIPARGLPYQLFALGVGPEDQLPELRTQLAAVIDQLRPWADVRRSVSFLSPDEAVDQRGMRELYGAELYDRLARIKREYDPTNMFRVNHNIEPA